MRKACMCGAETAELIASVNLTGFGALKDGMVSTMRTGIAGAPPSALRHAAAGPGTVPGGRRWLAAEPPGNHFRRCRSARSILPLSDARQRFASGHTFVGRHRWSTAAGQQAPAIFVAAELIYHGTAARFKRRTACCPTEPRIGCRSDCHQTIVELQLGDRKRQRNMFAKGLFDRSSAPSWAFLFGCHDPRDRSTPRAATWPLKNQLGHNTGASTSFIQV